MVELGKITKPDANNFKGKRKLYCVANVFSMEDAPDDYKEMILKYWDEVAAQIEKIETAGKIKKIFSEIILDTSASSLEVLDKISEKLKKIVTQKLEEGALLIPIEDRELLGELTDWSNCLRVIYTKNVFSKVFSFFNEVTEKRREHILNVIIKNLLESEAGLLIIKDEDRVKLQFPSDIEIFLITPPSYDDIIRWFRNKMMKEEK